MVARSMVWIDLFLIASIVMLIAVPRRRIIQLLPFGVVGGFILALVIQFIAVPWLHLWRFDILGVASVHGIPVFLALAWLPATIIFAHFLPAMRSLVSLIAYILAFAAGASLLEFGFVYFGYRSFIHWNIYLTFLLGAALHSSLAYYFLTVEHAREEAVPAHEENPSG